MSTRIPKRQTWLWALLALPVGAYSCAGRTNDGATDLGGEAGMGASPSSGGAAASGGGGLGGGTPTCDPKTSALGSDGECHSRAFEFTFEDGLSGAVIDSQDNVVVRGWSGAGSGHGSWEGPGFLLKLGPTGEVSWQEELAVGALDLVVDAEDNLYLSRVEFAGQGGAGPEVGVIEKLSPGGKSQWVEPIRPIDDYRDVLLALGDDGSLYAAGTTSPSDLVGSGGHTDVFVARYDLDGERLWSVELDSGDYDILEDLVVSSDGEVIVGTLSACDDEYSYCDPDLPLRWFRVRGLSPVDGSESWSFEPDAFSGLQLGLDSADNLLISATLGAVDHPAVLTKYDSAHEPSWSYAAMVGYEPVGRQIISGDSGVITWNVRSNDDLDVEEFALRLTPNRDELPSLSFPDGLYLAHMATRGDVFVACGYNALYSVGWLRKDLEP